MSSHYEKNENPKGLHRLMPSTRVSCLFANLILAISNKVGSELTETVGFNRKIKTVPVPVDYNRFANAYKGNIRREMGIEQSHIVIASIGHSVRVKGWDVAIKAFVDVYKKLPNVRMLLVGDQTSPEFYNQLTELIKQYKMEDNIKFAGKRNDIPEILKSSDIFILPSRSEGMPGALVEAMAAGLPCIAAEVGGVPEVIKHDDNGLLFKRANSQELAESLIKLIKNKKLQTKLASQASIDARQFNMESYVEKVFNHYQSLLNIDKTT
jgi:glycosyltransferase involved in cell wall biosynthesis